MLHISTRANDTTFHVGTRSNVQYAFFLFYFIHIPTLILNCEIATKHGRYV